MILPLNSKGSVLMLVVISGFIMSVVGLGTINLMGYQEIAARQELNVVRAGHVADAGIEMAKVWITTACCQTYYFPEVVKHDEYPGYTMGDTVKVQTYSFGNGASFTVSITPLPGNDVNLNTPAVSRTGSYLISSTATISTGSIDTKVNRSIIVNMWREATGNFVKTGLYPADREAKTFTLLPNGKVLLTGAGDWAAKATKTAMLFDPKGNSGAGSFELVGSLANAREFNSAALVPGIGVLITGGLNDTDLSGAGSFFGNEAEFFTANGNNFNTLPKKANIPRGCHWSTFIPRNNRVLLVSGWKDNYHVELNQTIESCELWNPANGDFTVTDHLKRPRHCFGAVKLDDDRVIVIGGDWRDTSWPGPWQQSWHALDSAEIYDPVQEKWVHEIFMSTPRIHHNAILLRNSWVLVVGGLDGSENLPNSKALDSAELFDPEKNVFVPIKGKMTTSREGPYAAVLPSGKVLIAGGNRTKGANPLQSTELYDPETKTFSPHSATMLMARTASPYNNCVTLRNGNVLFAGGFGWTAAAPDATKVAEVYAIPLLSQVRENSYVEGPTVRTVQ